MAGDVVVAGSGVSETLVGSDLPVSDCPTRCGWCHGSHEFDDLCRVFAGECDVAVPALAHSCDQV